MYERACLRQTAMNDLAAATEVKHLLLSESSCLGAVRSCIHLPLVLRLPMTAITLHKGVLQGPIVARLLR